MRWVGVTHLGGARATIGTGLLLIAVGERRLGLAVLVALTLSHVAVQVLKRAVARPRPCDANGHPLALVDLPDPFSFPSGHAAAASAIATALVLREPVVAVLVVPIAVLVSASRVALRVHHVSDVVAGVALGVAGGVAGAVLLLF
jgi:undecaprenyl-diphosphatase